MPLCWWVGWVGGSKLVVAKWGVEAGVGGPVRSVRTLLRAYGRNQPSQPGPALGGTPWGGAFGSVCSSPGPQGPDRTAETGLDPKFCHNPFRSIDHRTLHKFRLRADFAKACVRFEICLPRTHSDPENHCRCFSGVDSQRTSTVKNDFADCIDGGIQIVGGKMGCRGRFWRSGPVCEDPAMGIRAENNLPNRAPPSAGPLGKGFLGPYAHRRGFRDRTGPPKSASIPNFATTNFAPLTLGRYTNLICGRISRDPPAT